VVVLAKLPEPGRVKTRLCPPLTPDAAAELQQACLCDLWARLAPLSPVRRLLCHDPPDAGERFRHLLGGRTDLLAQVEGDLGDRLIATFQALFARGLGPIVALGADSPDLPLPLITHALQMLASDSCDVVVGPAADGGYTFIGLNRFYPEPFLRIPWSTSEVCAFTHTRCIQAGLRLETLESWEDVDDVSSLVRLCDRVFTRPADFPQLCRFFREHPYDFGNVGA
jgi:rSAM/selenodomain-associated transferase 1